MVGERLRIVCEANHSHGDLVEAVKLHEEKMREGSIYIPESIVDIATFTIQHQYIPKYLKFNLNNQTKFQREYKTTENLVHDLLL